MCLMKFFTGTIERHSPSDWIPQDGISVQDGKVTIDLKRLNVSLNEVPNVWMPWIPDTNSMDGVFDIGNNNILIAGSNSDDHKKLLDNLKAGDIAVYRTPNIYAIHRIVEIKMDNQGKYFRFKGDNNPTKDPDKVRESQISWVSIGTVY